MNNPDHISESLEKIFWVKILKFISADPGWKKFGINIPDPGTTATNPEQSCGYKYPDAIR